MTPPELLTLEEELFDHADIVFTGGHSLFEKKRGRHPHVYPFPSSVDVAHFAKARHIAREPADQAVIPHPRMGFFGVIDERMDIDLLRDIAAAHPDWHLVMLGPIVKIDPAQEEVHQSLSKLYEERGLLASPGGASSAGMSAAPAQKPRGGAIQFDMEESSGGGMEMDLGMGSLAPGVEGPHGSAATTAELTPEPSESDLEGLEPPEALDERTRPTEVMDLDASTIQRLSDATCTALQPATSRALEIGIKALMTCSRSRPMRSVSFITALATPPLRRSVLIVPTCATPWHETAEPRTHMVRRRLVAVPIPAPSRSASR